MAADDGHGLLAWEADVGRQVGRQVDGHGEIVVSVDGPGDGDGPLRAVEAGPGPCEVASGLGGDPDA